MTLSIGRARVKRFGPTVSIESVAATKKWQKVMAARESGIFYAKEPTDWSTKSFEADAGQQTGGRNERSRIKCPATRDTEKPLKEIAMVDKVPNDLAKNLTRYQELERKSKELQGMLSKAEAQKGAVKEDIYQRVCQEYQGQLDEVVKELDPLGGQIEEARKQVATQLDAVESKSKELQVKIDEFAFRHSVGEYDQAEFDNLQSPLKKEMDSLAKSAGDLKQVLNDIFAAKRPGDEAPQDAATAASPPPATPPTPKKAPAAKPAATKPAAPSAKPAMQPTPASDDAGDMVNPGDWMKEFQEDNQNMMRRSTDKADAKPAAPQTLSTDSDPLSDLADPSFESAPDKTPAAANQPQGDTAVGTSDPPSGFPLLIIVKGPGEGKKLPLVPMTMTVGREHDNNIELKDEDIARYHARISFQRGEYILEDLESSSGTWVNEQRITQVTLKHGDKIKLGSTELVIDYK